MASRPLVTVYDGKTGAVKEQVTLPAVFGAPIRLDVVHQVHRDMAKNRRQAYAISENTGHQTSAESWGTGRAVARIPRVAGGGTHRAGQGAYGNMCRAGRMFAPTKTYRRWHRKINKNQRRFAVVSALAASASAPLVLARGHRIEQIPEVPLVIADETINDLDKTSAAVELLRKVNAFADVEKVKNSRKIKRGVGKSRNRRYVQRRGPLVVYNEKSALVKAFRNLPGVELVSVNALNLLQLAPGGHVGRFLIWTKSALQRLDDLYGTQRKPSVEKVGYRLPRAALTNSDISRIINSEEVQAVLRPKNIQKRNFTRKKNPLRNLGALIKLNPHAKATHKVALRNATAESRKKAVEKRRAKAKAEKKAVKAVKTRRAKTYAALQA